MVETITVVRTFKDADERIRYEWGQALASAMATYRRRDGGRGINRKEFQQLLLDEGGIEVTVRAVGQWLAGETAPRPSVQAAIAHVLGMPPHMLFPLVHRSAA